MKWWRFWPETLLLAVLVALEGLAWSWNSNSTTTAPSPAANVWTPQRTQALRDKARQLWYHGYENYMTFAFPLDELSPLSCTGRGPNWDNPNDIASNDVAGNFSLTLIDVLDTLVVLDDRPGFEKAVRDVIGWVSFDVNTRPQVFETTIRVLGGLLSGHIFASKEGQPFHLPWYKGELLEMAHDLGKRLLPAFDTPTGLPYARINLRHGVPKGETHETCTAGAGSLILEFATLSRLTGDERFEKAAYKAFFALWNRKSDLGLVGNTIDTWTGHWNYPETTGIGAGIDSFYEYAFKWYVLSGEVEFLDVWEESYAALMRYSRATDGYWHRNVNIHSGDVSYYTVDSLSAFWPGLQVLTGDVQSAIRSHLMYWNVWRRHSGLPEVWDVNFKTTTSFQYPLRPEFIESTWYLYRATRDTFYLEVGERILEDLIQRAKVDCGLTGIADLRNNKRDDRMESFALSETVKYLYLLFDEENPLHSDDSHYVFTTEGHLLTLDKELLRPISAARRRMRRNESHQCPAYSPFTTANRFSTKSDGEGQHIGLVQGVRSRRDIDYSRELVGGMKPDAADEATWTPDGWCEKPKVEIYSYNFVLSTDGKAVPEDVSPSAQKISVITGGYVVNNITGIRTHIVRRLDGKGYDITKLGPHSVRTGQIVYINDPSIFNRTSDAPAAKEHERDLEIPLHFFVESDPLEADKSIFDVSTDMDMLVTAFTSSFGASLDSVVLGNQQLPRFGHGEGVAVHRDDTNLFGCQPYTRVFDDEALLVYRGQCTFLEKLVFARDAGASGVIVIGSDNHPIYPNADAHELDGAGDIHDMAIVALAETTGRMVSEMFDTIASRGLGRLMVAVDPQRRPATGGEGRVPDPAASQTQQQKNGSGNSDTVQRVLYLNGHPLLNTRLLI
ncbi:hypothetical protein HGRIS_009781 [Hohenbuehelia grisea]|uniref:alpha-1,2-Mannosidase n=1 Tax=Hohenbuehelia grisea TaxID=104357 RepID=A0ABR3J260_9AGAR